MLVKEEVRLNFKKTWMLCLKCESTVSKDGTVSERAVCIRASYPVFISVFSSVAISPFNF